MTGDEWYHKNVVEDEDFVSSVGTLSQKMLYQKFNITIKLRTIPIAMYAVIFDTIKSFLHTKEGSKSSYAINIADVLEIGFTSGLDEADSDAEKIGNYTLFIKNIESPEMWQKETGDLNSSVLCTQWMASLRVNESTQDMKEIAAKAFDNLHSDISIFLPSPDMVIPIFCTIHRQIIEQVKLMYVNSSQDLKDDFRLNFAGLFDISVVELEEGIQVLFKPRVSDKGGFKNDDEISSKNE